MLLKQLHLHNIRSYLDQSINFSNGSTLLAGDIGSGKSTLLMAIEFALFGTSRPNLPAESLLRKGSVEGHVRLTFNLEGQSVTIQRNLKMEKAGIKQLPGHIIQNDQKRDLMPVELKTEVIKLLGYPDDLLSKKNYLFRYTVYCPQEEMKQILHESPEQRLDTLRKVFNTEKYQRIRENCQIYGKQLRMDVAVLQGKLEPLASEKQNVADLQQDLKKLQTDHQDSVVQSNLLKNKLSMQTATLQNLELDLQAFRKLEQERHTTTLIISEKEKQITQASDEITQLEQQVSCFLIPSDVASVRTELLSLEKKQLGNTKLRNQLQEKMNGLQQRISEGQQEISELKDATKSLPERQQLFDLLNRSIPEKMHGEKLRRTLEEKQKNNITILSSKETILSSHLATQTRIAELSECPTCLQQVPAEHKHRITNHTQGQVKALTREISTLKNSQINLQGDLKSTMQKLEELTQEERLHSTVKLELKQLLEKVGRLQQLKDLTVSWVKENNAFMEQLPILTDYAPAINTLRNQMETHRKAEQLTQQISTLKVKLETIKEELSKLQARRQELNSSMVQSPQAKWDELQRQLQQTREEERNSAVVLSRISTELKEKQLAFKKAETILNVLIVLEKKLIKKKQVHQWVTEHFIPLTLTIEKHIMLNIYHLFNQLFQDWFSMLIDNPNIIGRLDDGFTPVIEQNGYEILFENLSGGEKTSAALAYRLALNKVINDVVHLIKTKDLLILDEPTDGFSSEHLDKVRDVFDRLNLTQIIAVSHESKIESFMDHVVRIRKEEDHSRVL